MSRVGYSGITGLLIMIGDSVSVDLQFVSYLSSTIISISFGISTLLKVFEVIIILGFAIAALP